MQALEAIEEAAEAESQRLMPQEAQKEEPAQPPQINMHIPDSLGQALGNAMLQGTQSILSNMPPLSVNMPSMKNTPVRGPDGMILHSIAEPMPPPDMPQAVN
jgi:hypothetical protein